MSMKQTIKRVMDAHGLTGTPGIVEYTCELLAELSKDEPVGYRYVDHNGHWCFNEMKFGDIAEPVYSHPAPVIASEQKPVAWIDEKQLDAMQVPQMSRVTFQTYLQATNVWPGTVPLFTNPPNTADIEKRVAEACAMVASQHNDFYLNCVAIAKKIRSGKWREYL